MAYLRDTGGRARLQDLFSQLGERLKSEVLPALAIEIAEKTSALAPSPEAEYATMNEGGVVFDSGTFKKNDETEASRIRFIKSPENYLQPFLRSNANWVVDGLRIGIGNILELDRISSYSYVNATTKTTYTHVVTYPFWRMWEHGGLTFDIVPKHFDARNPYPLLRYAPNQFATQMFKAIPAHYMFSSINLEDIVKEVLIPSIRQLVKTIN